MRARRAAVTGVTFAALTFGLVPEATFAASSSTQARGARPDAAIRYVGATSNFGSYAVDGRWIGGHVRNHSAADQTISRRFAGAAPRGTRYLFEVKLTNRGATGRLSLKAPGDPDWQVQYLVNGSDVTSAVRAGTFKTPVLARGESFLVRVKARLGVPGTALAQRLVATSAAAGSRDVVRLDLRYSGCGC